MVKIIILLTSFSTPQKTIIDQNPPILLSSYRIITTTFESGKIVKDKKYFLYPVLKGSRLCPHIQLEKNEICF